MKKILIAGALFLLIGLVAADIPYGRGYGMMGTSGYTDQLTNEQRATIRAKARELWEKGATHFEIATEIQKLLKEFGVETATGFGPDFGQAYGGGMMGGYGAAGCPGHGGSGMMGGW